MAPGVIPGPFCLEAGERAGVGRVDPGTPGRGRRAAGPLILEDLMSTPMPLRPSAVIVTMMLGLAPLMPGIAVAQEQSVTPMPDSAPETSAPETAPSDNPQEVVPQELVPETSDTLLEAEALADAFRSSGWDAVEATEGEGGITIEARRGGDMRIAVRYDPESGMVTAIAIENADGRPVLVPGATLSPAASL